MAKPVGAARKGKRSYGLTGVWVALGILAGALVVIMLLPDNRMVPEPLGPLGLPSDFKYQQVLKDEELRESIMRKTLSPEEEAEKAEGWRKNEFNQFISDRLGLKRRNYDTRDVACLSEKYLPVSVLPSTSVIIIFHNEARSTLLRTVWNVLDRSPPSLIHEILLIDDGSTLEHIGQPLEDEVYSIPKTRLLRMPERSGLIRAKVFGAERATGDVLLFLDSHCECVDGWLEPLLDRIKRNRTTIPMPVIDAIDQYDWELRTAHTQKGVFTWTEHFYWTDLTPKQVRERHSPAQPVLSPAMAGGIFAIDRKYFFEMGTYDEGQDTWGGENIEMSLRIWMCGGRLEVIPCSRVGHVFRDKTPYAFKHKDPAETIGHNYNRVAEVWMDDYKDIYYNHSDNKKYGFGDVSSRVALRQKLQCKDFQWYLDNVFPELFVPRQGNYKQAGWLRNPSSSFCVDTSGSKIEGKLDLRPDAVSCDGADPSWTWYLTERPRQGQLRAEHDKGSYCLRPESQRDKAQVLIVKCLEQEDSGLAWTYTAARQLEFERSKLCLTRAVDQNGDSTLISMKCQPNHKDQEWEFAAPSSRVETEEVDEAVSTP